MIMRKIGVAILFSSLCCLSIAQPGNGNGHGNGNGNGNCGNPPCGGPHQSVPINSNWLFFAGIILGGYLHSQLNRERSHLDSTK
jgi:hypothetical protein